MYVQMAGLHFMPTGAILYVINYHDLDRQYLGQELDERYEPFIYWGEVPHDFSYRAPYRYRFRDGKITPTPASTDGADVPDVVDYRLHHRRLRLIDRLYAALRLQRMSLVPGTLPLQDRLLDLAFAESRAEHRSPSPEPKRGSDSRPLLRAMAAVWNTTLVGAAERVRIEHADRQHALVQSEVHRLRAVAAVRAASTHAQLDALCARYGFDSQE